MEIRISEYAGPSSRLLVDHDPHPSPVPLVEKTDALLSLASCYSEEWGKDERLLYDARDCLDKILRWPEAEK
jgi:hypothetical protein